jgi:hypothetical protein
MQQQPLKAKPGSRRTTLATLLVAGAVLLGLAGLYLYIFDPPKPFVVRWQVDRYLKSKAGNRDFTVNFPFPSKAEMAKSGKEGDKGSHMTKGPKTGKDFDTLREEYLKEKSVIFRLQNSGAEAQSEIVERKQMIADLTKELAAAEAGSLTNLEQIKWRLGNQTARVATLEKTLQSKEQTDKEAQAKEQALEPVVSDLWEFQKAFTAELAVAEASQESALAKARLLLNNELRQKLDEATTYAGIYRVIGQELYLASRLLESRNLEHRRLALREVLLAIQHSMGEAENYWLAARICEGYIWPNLDASEEGRQSQLSYDGLMNTCANAFRLNGEYDLVVRNYERMISQSTNQVRKDMAYMQIALAYDQTGDYKGALSAARSIKATNNFMWVTRRIPQWERQVQFRAQK